MILGRRDRRRAAAAERMLSTRFLLRLDGADVVGPLTLEQFALITRYGGYPPGSDLLSHDLYGSVAWRAELLIWPGT